MPYVDIFAAAVPTANRDAYETHARRADAAFRDHGATRVVENWGDDVPAGELTSFPLAVKAGDDETVVVGWVEWPSKAARDAAWPKIMQDERMAGEMPFDGKRLIHGGFEMMFEA